MKWEEAFPSAYLNAGDIPVAGVTVTILTVAMVDVNDDGSLRSVKPVATLKGQDKGLIINQANKASLEGWFGDEMDACFGKSVMLHRTKVPFGRRMVDAIRMLPAPDVSSD